MKREVTAEETIQHMNGGYDIIPSNIMLAGAEQELSQTGKEHRQFSVKLRNCSDKEQGSHASLFLSQLAVCPFLLAYQLSSRPLLLLLL